MEIKSLSGVISEMMVQKIKEMPKKLYSKWRTADLFSSIFGVLGIITATAGYERGFSPTRTHDNCEEFPNETDRFLTLILTIISMIFLIKRHQLKSRWKQKRLPPYSANISKLFLEKKSFLSIRLFIELLILGIFPYPYIKGELRYQQANLKELNDFENYEIELCYTVSEILYILMFSRFFFLLRTVFNFTPYQDDHARYNCRKYKTRANVRFSVRCMMKTHPFMIIYGISFFSFLLLGVLLRVCERPYTDVSNLNFESFENSIWNTGITMATIGFGDLYPSTILGRVIGITCAMWGGFVFSMIVFTFESMLELDTQQKLAFFSIKKTRAAAWVIINSLKYQLYKNTKGSEAKETQIQKKLVKRRLKKFVTTIEKLKKVDTNINDEINKFSGLSRQVSILENNIALIESLIITNRSLVN